MSTCKACGTLIDWVQTTAGKWMPLDPEPVYVVEGEGTDRFVTDEGQIHYRKAGAPGRTIIKNACGVRSSLENL